MTQPPTPGWHPDPEGTPNQLRWWDGRQWTSATQSTPTTTTSPTSQVPREATPNLGTPGPDVPRNKSNRTVIVAIMAGVLIIGLGIVIANHEEDKDVQASSVKASTTQTTSSRPPTTTRSAADVSASAAAATSARAASEAAAAAEAEAKRQAEAAKLDPNTYESISDRDFALFAKNPDTYKGRKLTLYGIVTQADAATGNKMFLARTAGSPQDASYNYDQNTIVTAVDPNLIADVVEDDFVTLHVEVLGSQSYDTQRGGNTTAPKVQVNIVTVTGSK